MRTALTLAKKGQGAVEPNPMVGAVLVKDGQVVAKGYHRAFGGLHAEVNALADARKNGIDPAQCTMYVTLEPCCHHGKTPPCTQSIIDAGIKRVVVAMIDPSDHVGGKGKTALIAAGVDTQVGVLEADARQLNEPFVHWVQKSLPWVIAKWAQTLDGKIATASGDSQWISNEKSRAFVHQLRGKVDVVMVGIGTALADDPQLTARPSPKARVQRIARRCVVDPDLRLPADARLFNGLANSPCHGLTIATREITSDTAREKRKSLIGRGAEVVELPLLQAAEGQLDLTVLMRHFAQAHDATNVLVEGGSHLHGCLFKQRLTQRVLAFVCPKLLADDRAMSAARGRSVEQMTDAVSLRLVQSRRFDDDMLLDYRVEGS